MHGAYGLQFDNNLIIYKHVYTLWMVVILAKHIALVDYGTRHLPLHFMAALRQFPDKSRLVGLFFQSTPQFGMNFYRSVYDLPS